MRNKLEAYLPTLITLMGDEKAALQYVEQCLNAYYSSANLMNAGVDNAIAIFTRMATSGLSPDPKDGHVYYMSYGGKAIDVEVSPKGIRKQFINVGWIPSATPVFKCDSYEITSDGSMYKLRVNPNMNEHRAGDAEWCMNNLLFIYVLAENTDGSMFSTVADASMIEARRMCSRSQKNPKVPTDTWGKFYLEMAIKSGLKILSDILPVSNFVNLDFSVDDTKPLSKQPPQQDSPQAQQEAKPEPAKPEPVQQPEATPQPRQIPDNNFEKWLPSFAVRLCSPDYTIDSIVDSLIKMEKPVELTAEQLRVLGVVKDWVMMLVDGTNIDVVSQQIKVVFPNKVNEYSNAVSTAATQIIAKRGK